MQKDKYNKHNSGIDVLRGLAIFSVILLHVNIRVPFSQTFIGGALPVAIYKILFWSGYYGVCIFFVISGFLITTSTLNKWGELPMLSLRGFYTTRFARIMPLLVALLVVLSLLHLAGVNGFVINSKRTSLGQAIFAALTFHINWLEIKIGYLPAAWDILWSLSIEEVFYLFFPLVFILLRKEKYFVFLVLAFLFISPFARTSWFLGYGFDEPDRNHFAFLDTISLGCMAAIVVRRIEINKIILRGMAIMGLAMMALVLFFRSVAHDLHLGQTGLNVTVLAIGAALVLIWMQKRFVNRKQKPMLSTAVIRFFGRNSYEVYLTHMFVVFALVETYHALKLSGEWVWGLYISVFLFSGLLGEFVARYFSNPVNSKLRELIKHFNLKTNK
jgi:peptidoglycan/LPS O-acetylase OafA/YrhL